MTKLIQKNIDQLIYSKCVDLKLGPRKNLVGQKFGRLTILSLSHRSKSAKYYWKCKCDCGGIKTVQTQSLKAKITRSCGCLEQENREKIKNDLTGKKFNKWTVLQYSHRTKGKDRKIFYKCRCDCGIIRNVRYGHLTHNLSKSCGCNNFENGVPISNKQKELKDIIGRGILNYKFDNIYIDVALVKDKIAIEYDEWYWHKNKFDKDCKRVNKLLNSGWKVITIRAHNNLPNKQELLKTIEYVKQTNGKVWNIITLYGWGK